jgi:hypothetical protein
METSRPLSNPYQQRRPLHQQEEEPHHSQWSSSLDKDHTGHDLKGTKRPLPQESSFSQTSLQRNTCEASLSEERSHRMNARHSAAVDSSDDSSTMCYYSISSLSSPLVSFPVTSNVGRESLQKKPFSCPLELSKKRVIANPYKKIKTTTQSTNNVLRQSTNIPKCNDHGEHLSSSTTTGYETLVSRRIECESATQNRETKPVGSTGSSVIANPYLKSKNTTPVLGLSNNFHNPNHRVPMQTKNTEPLVEYTKTQQQQQQQGTYQDKSPCLLGTSSFLITPTTKPRNLSCHPNHATLSCTPPQQQIGGETVMFLVEALKELKDDATSDSLQNSTIKSSLRIQIMGHVMSEPYSLVYQGEDFITFCLDDGTAMVDVLCKNHSLQSTKNPRKEQLFSSLSLPPLPQVKMGSCIDCKGILQYVRLLNVNHGGERDKYELVPCFVVRSISFVVDPNMEVLRMTQLIHVGKKQSKIPSDLTARSTSDWASSVAFHGTVKDRTLYIFGNAQRKVVDSMRLLHLICVSTPKGLTRKDLEVLFQIETEEERRCLMLELNALQSNYDIYTSRSGAYLPL